MDKKRVSSLDRTFQESLLLLRQYKDVMNFRVFLEHLSEKGAELVILILSLPFCLPLHIPGLSTPFGLVIALIGITIILGRPIWLPKFLLEKKISPAFLKKLIKRSLSLIKKLKRWIRPRWFWLSSSGFTRGMHGPTIILLGLLLALPLPIPTTNLGFAWPLLLINVGLLERDGLFIFLGYVIFVCYSASLITVGLLL